MLNVAMSEISVNRHSIDIHIHQPVKHHSANARPNDIKRCCANIGRFEAAYESSAGSQTGYNFFTSELPKPPANYVLLTSKMLSSNLTPLEKSERYKLTKPEITVPRLQQGYLHSGVYSIRWTVNVRINPRQT